MVAPSAPLCGFLNLHKDQGWTSHDCVAKVRRLLRLKKVGHGGTLDPRATGVLPIALGAATRLLPYLPTRKAYRGTIRLGLTTSTDDLDGVIQSETPAAHLTLDAIVPHLAQFQGQFSQIPPRYSAIQVQGQRLYDLARDNREFVVPSRSVEVYGLEVVAWQGGDAPELTVDIRCGAGTYIRSIARDLGASLGVGGTLAHLIRTESSGFKLEDSLTLDTLQAQIQDGTFQPLTPARFLDHLPTVYLDPLQAQGWHQGKKLPLEALSDQGIGPDFGPWVRVLGPGGQGLGVGEVRGGEMPCLKPQVVLPEQVPSPE